MANESDVSHVPTMLMVMYGAVALYSWFVSSFTGSAWWLQLAFYFVDLLVFYAWHWACHQSWSPMFPMHMQHHLTNNPVSRFFSSDEQNLRKYGRTDFDSWAKALVVLNPMQSSNVRHGWKHEGPLFAANAVVLAVAANFVSLGDLVGAFFMGGAMGILGAGLHSSFHVRSFVLTKYAWYRELRALHFLHHCGDQKANLAVLNLGIDHLFGSLAMDDPLRHRKQQRDAEAVVSDDEQQTTTISKKTIRKILANGKSASFLLGSGISGELPDEEFERLRAVHAGWPSVLARIVLFCIALLVFLEFEPMLTRDGSEFVDHGHAAFASLRAFIIDRPALLLALCSLSSLMSELSVWILVAASLFGPTTKPLVAGLTAFLMRLVVNVLNAHMPTPPDAVWNSSQTVQLLTAVASSTTFLSARVITASTFFLMVAKFKRWSRPLRVAVRVASALALAFQIALTLAMQTNWTSDVIFACALAFAASRFAAVGARFLDTGLP
jgi:hypothetical protein